jgi:hypothetical protein
MSECYELWAGTALALLTVSNFSPFAATAPVWALAYLHETLRFTSVYQILDIR